MPDVHARNPDLRRRSRDRPDIGYTRNVVAFQGQQNGGWISVVSYDDPQIGWIDGTTIKPFQPAYPGQRCIVTVDISQRPIFQIY